jgi:hypothetical protein
MDLNLGRIGVNTLTSKEINCLGQAINTTFGMSSYEGMGASAYVGTPKPNATSVPFGTSATLEGNIMTIKCVCVINLLQNGVDMREQAKRYDHELNSLCNEYIKGVKSEFKKLSGRALKSKDIKEDESIELLNYSAFSPKRTAYYRKNFYFELS